jgi:hypothetical protein
LNLSLVVQWHMYVQNHMQKLRCFFLSHHQDCINILIYNNYCIDYTHTLYIFNKIFVCLANFGVPWDSSKLCAHSGKTRKNCIFLILHGIMFFLYGPSIRIFSKKLTSMDMIIVIVYNISPTHIIFHKWWISKKKLSQNSFSKSQFSCGILN